MMRRRGDRTSVGQSLFGAALAVGALALRHFGDLGDWPTIALVLVGGVLVDRRAVTGLVGAWRRGKADTAEQPTAGDDPK